MSGEKEEMVPRPFLEMGVSEKEEQPSEEKVKVDLMHQCKGSEKEIEDKLDSGRESSKASRMEQLSTKLPKLDQNSETLSMIKKARVSVRARSDSTMVSKLSNKQMQVNFVSKKMNTKIVKNSC